MEINITPSYTEIYSGGGGKCLTESFPTNFHRFFTRKILARGEKPEDFIDVTPEQREAIEKSDAAWERPTRWVIDQFDADPNGRFNEATGFGELNGITDLSPGEMLDIAILGRGLVGQADFKRLSDRTPAIRANLTPLKSGEYLSSASGLFELQGKIEHIQLVPGRFGEYDWKIVRPTVGWMTGTFRGCERLRIISGVLDLLYVTGTENVFQNCRELREVRIRNLKTGIGFAQSPLLSFDSLAYLVGNAANTVPIVVTVHPAVFARLGEEWGGLIDMAADKNITFAEAPA